MCVVRTVCSFGANLENYDSEETFSANIITEMFSFQQELHFHLIIEINYILCLIFPNAYAYCIFYNQMQNHYA